MQRRRLLKVGLGSTALLVVAGGGFSLLRPGVSGGQLSADAAAVFHAVAKAVLDKSLPALQSQRDEQLRAHLQRLSVTVAAFPLATQIELSQLLALLASAPGRALMTGLHTGWRDADIAEVQASLERMRTSSLKLRQQTYHALRDLTNAAYYADPIAWPLMGYPGPVAV
jgi:hypothetical protein